MYERRFPTLPLPWPLAVKLSNYLESHSEDITAGINDFDELRELLDFMHPNALAEMERRKRGIS